VKKRETIHRPTKREGMDGSYAVSDEGVDFQAESSATSYAIRSRITRSRRLNLPPTDPGD
jgi:hypothetical protein